MGETEFKVFVVIISLILMVFIAGIIIFFLKYHQRKLRNERGKAVLNELHEREMYKSKLEVQAQTMQDIGREIHDNVGQLLTVASISAYQLVYDDVCTEQNMRITDIGKIIDRSLEELRSLSRNLTDEQVEMADVVESMKEECIKINSLGVCQMKFDYNESNFTLSNITKNYILRIIQEFVQNSLKRSGCSNIVLQFNYQFINGLTIHIYDDGKGFIVSEIEQQTDRGIGLKNMKKRSEMIGAEFTFNSMQDIGTSINILIPTTQLNFR